MSGVTESADSDDGIRANARRLAIAAGDSDADLSCGLALLVTTNSVQRHATVVADPWHGLKANRDRTDQHFVKGQGLGMLTCSMNFARRFA